MKARKEKEAQVSASNKYDQTGLLIIDVVA